MRILLLILATVATTTHSNAQGADSTKAFGASIGARYNGELAALQIGPSAIYTSGKNQFEVGLGMNPFSRGFQQLFSTELNYKWFPNGTEKKFSMYFISELSHVFKKRETYFLTTYNYWFLNGGYGVQIKSTERLSIGTNMTFGVFTFNRQSDIPYEPFTQQKLFEELGYNVGFQFNVGYLF